MTEQQEKSALTPLEYTNANLWDEWFPEEALADLLAGRDIEPNIGQVRGAWKEALEREVKAGRLVRWKGHWYPVPGASFGLGPLKTCYGTAAARDCVLTIGRGQKVGQWPS